VQGTRYSKFYIGCLKENGKIQTKIMEKLNNNVTSSQDSMDEIQKKMKVSIVSAAEEILGYQSKYNPREWFDRKCQDATEIKNKKYVEFIETATRKRQEAYKEARSIAGKICRKKKWEFLNN
jgi:alpha-D-ribose 1-methylphosphonate 5-triphosphate diphosphatase PhnM